MLSELGHDVDADAVLLNLNVLAAPKLLREAPLGKRHGSDPVSLSYLVLDGVEAAV